MNILRDFHKNIDILSEQEVYNYIGKVKKLTLSDQVMVKILQLNPRKLMSKYLTLRKHLSLLMIKGF